MTYDPSRTVDARIFDDPWMGRPPTPIDHDAPRRVARLRELGLGDRPDPHFDDLARDLAHAARALTGAATAPHAMVNFIDERRQYFAGLYLAAPAEAGPATAVTGAPVKVGREMDRDHGYCPHVVVRRRALVLDNICDYPRFNTNPVVDELDIASYLGAPLIDPATGIALGTVCVIDTEPRPYGRPGLDLIKAHAAQLIEIINRRDPKT